MLLSGSTHTHWGASAGSSGACNAPRRGALVGETVWAPPAHERIRVRETYGVAVRLGESGEIEPGWSAAICGLVDVPKDTDTGWRSGWVSPVRSSRDGLRPSAGSSMCPRARGGGPAGRVLRDRAGMVHDHLRARQCVQGHGVVVWLGEGGAVGPEWAVTICGFVNVFGTPSPVVAAGHFSLNCNVAAKVASGVRPEKKRWRCGPEFGHELSSSWVRVEVSTALLDGVRRRVTRGSGVWRKSVRMLPGRGAGCACLTFAGQSNRGGRRGHLPERLRLSLGGGG